MPSLLDELDRAHGIEPDQPQVKRVEPFKPAVLPGTHELPAPGIYFGVPEEEYHAWPALSSHGIKDLAASPMLFWARRTWLSEAARKREAEEAAKPDKRLYRTIGKAYHCRILEGAEAYTARFACELSPDDCKDALESTDQIKAAIASLGAKPVSKVEDFIDGGPGEDAVAYQRAAKKEDWIAQLEALDKEKRFKILGRLQSEHGKLHAGKSFIPWDAHEQIEIAAAMIEADPQAKHAVKGGYPEVSLIWHCAETGVPMKARVDRLKLKAAVDLKSIACGDMSIERALTRAIAAHKYNFQPSVYLEGIQAVKEIVREHGGNAVVGGGTTDDVASHIEWARKWAAEQDEPEWWFLFQAKGIAPITRLKRYPGGSGTRYATDQIVRQAKRQFRELSESFGTEPWLDIAQASDINDDDLPNWVIDV